MLYGPALLLAHLQGNYSNRSLHYRAFSKAELGCVVQRFLGKVLSAAALEFSPLFRLAAKLCSDSLHGK